MLTQIGYRIFVQDVPRVGSAGSLLRTLLVPAVRIFPGHLDEQCRDSTARSGPLLRTRACATTQGSPRETTREIRDRGAEPNGNSCFRKDLGAATYAPAQDAASFEDVAAGATEATTLNEERPASTPSILSDDEIPTRPKPQL